MILTYHGQTFVKLQTGDTVIAINPISKDSGKKVTRFGSDIALVSNNLPISNGVDQVEHSGKTPFVITGAGEYETKGVSIKGIHSNFMYGETQKVNTIYTFTFDNIKVCVLGVINEKLSGDIKDAIGEVDVLILPVLEGEKLNYLNSHDAQSTALALSAKVIIPVGFNDKTLPLYLKESGSVGLQAVEKLTIKRKDIDSKQGEVVILDEI